MADPVYNGTEGYSEHYNAGGIAYEDNGADVGTFGGLIGRFKNNISGTTAQNIYNSTEAQKARDWSAIEAEKTRSYNSEEAQKARDFELYMSNTAYSRAAADMKAAGINPAMLSGLSGSGMRPASSSSGAQASSSNPSPGAAAHSSTAAGGSGIVGGILKLAGMMLMLAGHPGAGATAGQASALASSTKAMANAKKVNPSVSLLQKIEGGYFDSNGELTEKGMRRAEELIAREHAKGNKAWPGDDYFSDQAIQERQSKMVGLHYLGNKKKR